MLTGAGPPGSRSSFTGSLQRLAQDGRHFARHADVAPQVRAVRDGLVVDLDDAVGHAAGERRAHLASRSSRMPEWSRLMPSSAPLASMPSLSMPLTTFLPDAARRR